VQSILPEDFNMMHSVELAYALEFYQSADILVNTTLGLFKQADYPALVKVLSDLCDHS
jgi:hypothetical protein